PFERSELLPAIMDVRTHPISFASRPLKAVCATRSWMRRWDRFLHLLNSTRRPRRESQRTSYRAPSADPTTGGRHGCTQLGAGQHLRRFPNADGAGKILVQADHLTSPVVAQRCLVARHRRGIELTVGRALRTI